MFLGKVKKRRVTRPAKIVCQKCLEQMEEKRISLEVLGLQESTRRTVRGMHVLFWGRLSRLDLPGKLGEGKQ